MSWDEYKKIESICAAEGMGRALKEFDSISVERLSDFTALAMLKASYLEQTGNLRGAVECHLIAHNSNSNEYWPNFHLARIFSNLREYESSISHMHQAHAAYGWHESGQRGYSMTHDFFSPNIPQWNEYFSGIVGKRHLRFLEIGSWQGGSATWMLDKVLTASDAHLTCIDTWEGSSEHQNWIHGLPQTIEGIFDDNIRKTGSQAKVRKLKGYSQDALRGIQSEKFDGIYIDGAHEAKFVIQDAILCWSILSEGGVMLFDDYPFNFEGEPEQNTAVAIDFFLTTFKKDIEVLDKTRQVLIRKLPSH